MSNQTKHNDYFNVDYTPYTLDLNENLECNGNRIRTKKQLNELNWYVTSKIRNLYSQFDKLRFESSEHGKTSFLRDFTKAEIVIKQIAFYHHILNRCAIYFNETAINAFRKLLQ